MEAYTRLEFKNLCRLCISYSQSSHNIFGSIEVITDLKSKLWNCLSIKVEEDDPLPKKICKTCLDKLESFNEFRLLCANSDSTLLCYYNSLLKNSTDSVETAYIKVGGAGYFDQNFQENCYLDSKPNQDIDNNIESEEIKDADSRAYDFSSDHGLDNTKLLSLPNTRSDHLGPSSLNKANEMIFPEEMSYHPSTAPFSTNSDNIFVFNIHGVNKSNLLNFIDPSAAIYVVNTDSKNRLDNDVVSPLNPDSSKLLTKAISTVNEIRQLKQDANIVNMTELQSDKNFLLSQIGGKLDMEEIASVDQEDPINISKETSATLPMNQIAGDIVEDIVQVPSVKLEPGKSMLNNRFVVNELNTHEEQIESLYVKKENVETLPHQIVDSTADHIVPPLDQKAGAGQIISSPLVVKKIDLANSVQQDKSEKTSCEIPKHQVNQKYKCNKCFKCFIKLHNLEKHEGIHLASDKINKLTSNTCTVSQVSFDSHAGLSAHLTTHEDEGVKTYKCELCEKSYARRWHLNRHVKNVHHSPSQDLHCPICLKTFKRKDTLQDHMQTHGDTRKSLCDSKKRSPAHKAKKAISFKCRICEIQFNSKTVYLKHLDKDCRQATVSKFGTSQGELFKCDRCDESFNLESELRSHTDSHPLPWTNDFNSHMVEATGCKLSSEDSHLGMSESSKDTLTLFGNGVSVELMPDTLKIDTIFQTELPDNFEGDMPDVRPFDLTLSKPNEDIKNNVWVQPPSCPNNFPQSIDYFSTDKDNFPAASDNASSDFMKSSHLKQVFSDDNYLKPLIGGNCWSSIHQDNASSLSNLSNVSDKTSVRLLDNCVSDAATTSQLKNKMSCSKLSIGKDENQQRRSDNNASVGNSTNIVKYSHKGNTEAFNSFSDKKYVNDMVCKIAKNLENETKSLLNSSSPAVNENVYEFTLDNENEDNFIVKSFRETYRRFSSRSLSNSSKTLGGGNISPETDRLQSGINDGGIIENGSDNRSSGEHVGVNGKFSGILPAFHRLRQKPLGSLSTILQSDVREYDNFTAPSPKRITESDPYYQELDVLIKQTVETLDSSPEIFSYSKDSEVLKEVLPSANNSIKTSAQVIQRVDLDNSVTCESKEEIGKRSDNFVKRALGTDSLGSFDEQMTLQCGSMNLNKICIDKNPSGIILNTDTHIKKHQNLLVPSLQTNETETPIASLDQVPEALSNNMKPSILSREDIKIPFNPQNNNSCLQDQGIDTSSEKRDLLSTLNVDIDGLEKTYSDSGKAAKSDNNPSTNRMKWDKSFKVFRTVQCNSNGESSKTISHCSGSQNNFDDNKRVKRIKLNENVETSPGIGNQCELKKAESTNVVYNNIGSVTYVNCKSGSHISESSNKMLIDEPISKLSICKIKDTIGKNLTKNIKMSKAPKQKKVGKKMENAHNQVNNISPSKGFILIADKSNCKRSGKAKGGKQTQFCDTSSSQTDDKSEESKCNTKQVKLNTLTLLDKKKRSEPTFQVKEPSQMSASPDKNSAINVFGSIQDHKDYLKPECSNSVELKTGHFDKNVSGSESSEDLIKPPIKTIRILLERFDPHKLPKYLSKEDPRQSTQNSLQSQPYNLRKSKEIQTYICTMEDS